MIFLAVFVILAVLIAIFAFLFRALVTRPVQNFSVDWLNGFSLEIYAPMERLLDKSDIVFLESLPGYRPEIGKRLMADRRKVFRGYLRLLIRDFDQFMALGKFMAVHAAEDRPDLAKALWRQQVSFYFAVCAIQCKLALCPLGWPKVDVQGLVEALAGMRDQLQMLAPQVATAQSA